MAATRKDVDRWISMAKSKGATHIVSVCDTFDYDDYPVFVMEDEDVEQIRDRYNRKNMQRVNEVIEIKP